MSDQATRIVPAGWYEDPASPAHVRWWNGLAWTEHIAQKPPTPPQHHGRHAQAEPATTTGSTPIDPVTTTGSTPIDPATATRIAEARELERQYGISTAEHAVIVQRATEGSLEDRSTGPGAHAVDTYRPAWEADQEDEAPRTATASAWLLALWPVLTLIALVVAAYVWLYVSPEPTLAGIPVVFGVALVPYLLSIIWAIADARGLRALGEQPPNPLWSLAGPLVYLIARRLKVRGSGPLAMFLALFLLGAGGPIAAFATGAAAPMQVAAEVQQTVRSGLLERGTVTNVSCPFLIETTAAGTIYTCTATLPDGTDKTVFVVFDDTHGNFSYSLSAR